MRLDKVFDRLIEELLEESAKTDFVAKFGDKALNDFDKAKDRLRNKGMSVDYGQYLKMTPKELQDTILSLYDDKKDSQKKRIIQGNDKEIRGKYKYLGEKDGYKVYQPLDVKASMDLGVNTGWCTTGRWSHAGHPEFTPNETEAKKHWKDYTSKGVEFYYFLNPQTMYGEYAVAMYPQKIDLSNYEDYYEINELRFDNKFIITATNIEIFNAKDEMDYAIINKLPLDLIPKKVIFKYKEMPAFEIESSGILKGYWGEDKDVVVPDSVDVIDNGAFYHNKKITSVTLPDVTYIGDYAFEGCSNLTGVNIPNSVTYIGDGTFDGCSKITNISIPENVLQMGISVFQNCTSLRNVNISTNIKDIGMFTFAGCKNLVDIKIHNHIRHIGSHAFFGCSSLTSVTVPDSVEIIDGWAFEMCNNLKQIRLPNSIMIIPNTCFSGCTNLTNVNIPNKVTLISSEAFYDCNKLTNINIPNRVIEIYNRAFKNCNGLTSIVIPDSVMFIGDETFCNCTSLTSITIGNGVKEMWSDIFKGCPSSLIVKTNNQYVINYCKKYNIKYIEE